MIPFLKSLANAFAERYSDLSGHLFIFPSRRAGTFFIKYLKEAIGSRTAVLPAVTTMSDFVEDVSGRVLANRLELLFMLYEAYTELLAAGGVSEMPTFDSFRRWGETAISDFNEVDMQGVDADAIFKNVKDIKEISANFLTEEQMKVMEEYFGVAYDPEAVSKDFWKSYIEHEDDSLHSKFRLLWQVLAPLYHRMHEKLEGKGLESTGGIYKLAAQRLEEGYLPARKVVAVGFNALTATERRIFDALAAGPAFKGPHGEEPFADFFWDATGPVLTDSKSTASRYVAAGIRRYPAPEWGMEALRKSDTDKMPENMKVIAVPSNSAQTKVVGETLLDMKRRIPADEFGDARVAVVLPDESLLIPMLYSIPEGIGDINLTMGYPMKQTSTVSFVYMLRRVQRSRRKSGDSWGYYYKDLNLLLSHPFCHSLFRTAGVGRMKEWISTHHRSIVNPADLTEVCGEAAEVLAPLAEDSSPRDVVVWLKDILLKVAKSLAEFGSMMVKSTIEIANIETYLIRLSQLLDITDEYDMDMKWPTFMTLLDRLIAGETVNFEGEPLKGLQIMGILETRALDFDRIIIPSLNERILPARNRTRTFISESLRKAYGLPPVSYSESIFAYYFYRMISRAKEVVLLYDSRTSSGVKNGDVSRYVLQLQYLHARETLKRESRTFMLSKSDASPAAIEKSEPVREMLRQFLAADPEGRNLSATALHKYTSCNLKFYFEELLGIRTDETATDYIDAITQGNIVHYVMQRIYLPEDKQQRYLDTPQIIDADVIHAKIADRANIRSLIRRAVNHHHFRLDKERLDEELTGSSVYVAKVIESQIADILRFDLNFVPFKLYGVEIDRDVRVAMPDGSEVNMRFAIDRLDEIDVKINKEMHTMLRIVDYKTGSIHNEATDMDSIFNGEYKAGNLLQLLLYANLFDAISKEDMKIPKEEMKKEGKRPLLKLFDSDTERECSRGMCLELYEVGKLNPKERRFPEVENVTYRDHSKINQPFIARLRDMLEEIFDPEVPFRPTSDTKTCEVCGLKEICFR